MFMLFFCIALILLSFMLSNRLKIKENFALVIGASVIIICGLIFGMVNLLLAGTFIVYALSLIVGGICAVRNIKLFKEFLLKLPIVAFIFACIVTSIMFFVHPPFFTAWDEFSHWGPFLFFVKNTNKLHIFLDRDFTHQAYPQALTVFYYIGSFGAKNYNETSVFLVYSVFLHICSVSAIPSIPIGERKKFSLLIIILTPFFLYMFPYASYAAPYTSAYLDPILCAYFGAVMCFLMQGLREGYTRSNGICTTILLFVLLQIKDISIAFYLIGLATYAINLFVVSKHMHTKKYMVAFEIGVYGIGLPMIGKFMWDISLKVTNKSQDQFSESITSRLLSLIQEYNSGQNSYLIEVCNAFLNGIKNVNISWERTSILVIVFVYALTGIYIAYKYYTVEKTKVLFIHMILMVMYFVCYMFMLLIVYLWAMSPGEAMSNASMDRYTACFVGAWAFLLFSLILNYLSVHNIKLAVAVILSAALFIYGTIPLNGIVYFQTDKEGTGLTYYEQQAIVAKEYVGIDDIIWIMQMDSENLLVKTIMSYELMPCIVKQNAPMDISSLSAEDIITMANNLAIDYFIVMDSTVSFIDKYNDIIVYDKNISDDRLAIFKVFGNQGIEQIY